MKKYLILLLLFVLTFSEMYSQSQGISYQAVIIDSNAYEIPGQDINGNFLPQKEIAVRFTIYDQSGNIDYQETQSTKTDQFGMIHLVIGKGEPTGAGLCPTFKDIDWNGTSKSLEVEISISNSFNDFVELSKEKLLFVPYAFHRNITATGTMIIDGASTLKSSLTVANNSPTYLSGQLTVDGASVLNGTLTVNSPVTFSSDLNVEGTTNLNDTLNVKNNSPVNFSGKLNVDGVTNLNDTLNVKNNSPVNFSGDLNVDGTTNLNNTFYVNNSSTSNLSGDLNVGGTSNLNGPLNVTGTNPASVGGDLTVNGKSHLNNQLIVNADLNGSQNNKNSYPLRVEGSNQGIAISIDVSRKSSTNFITFWDKNGIQGNIEGQTTSELHNSFDYIWYQTYQSLMTAFEVAAVTADLVGLDDADMSVVESVELVASIAQWGKQTTELENNVGISFNSGGADYAEYLEKENPQEQFSYGDIVGVKGGKISKTMQSPDNYMIISKNPIVLGNLPPKNEKQNFEKVAFMGQVLVKVIGIVKIGDYIIASDRNDGIGIAVNPNKIKPDEYKKIVGVAWSESNAPGLSMINVAVGINTNYTANLVEKYQQEINQMKDKTNSIIAYLNTKDPDFKMKGYQTDTANYVVKTDIQNDTLDYSTTMSIIKENLKNNPDFIKQIQANARKMLDDKNIDYKKYEQTNKLVSDPEYAIKVIEEYSN